MAVKQTDSEQARSTGQEPQPGQSREDERGRQQQQNEAQQHHQGRQQTYEGQERGLARRDVPLLLSPFALLQRFFTDDITELFAGRGAGRGLISQQRDTGADRLAWAPRIDVTQRGDELVVHADLPGMKPDDVVVEVSDDAITISGERQQEHEEERGSVYRFERSYGAFFRVIPLPQGAIVDQAKASFKNGVLEITVPAPPEQVARGRRLDISGPADSTT